MSIDQAGSCIRPAQGLIVSIRIAANAVSLRVATVQDLLARAMAATAPFEKPTANPEPSAAATRYPKIEADAASNARMRSLKSLLITLSTA